MIPAKTIHRHLFWSNFELSEFETKKDNLRSAQVSDLELHHGYDLSKYKIKDKRKILRNCVQPGLGLNIYNDFLKTK